jgi:hypothetical protein
MYGVVRTGMEMNGYEQRMTQEADAHLVVNGVYISDWFVEQHGYGLMQRTTQVLPFPIPET